MKKLLMVSALVVAGCTAEPGDDRSLIERALPNTTTGFKEGGVVGAVEGATTGVILICRQLDGAEFRASVDAAALAFDATATIEAIRAKRAELCVKAAALNAVADLATNPVVDAKVVEVGG